MEVNCVDGSNRKEIKGDDTGEIDSWMSRMCVCLRCTSVCTTRSSLRVALLCGTSERAEVLTRVRGGGYDADGIAVTLINDS